MARGSAAFSIVRFFMGLGIFGLMAMLYWSSLLVENDLREVKRELRETRRSLRLMKNGPAQTPASEIRLASRGRPHLDAGLPNLLQDDPFYQKTLPGLLPTDFKPSGNLYQGTIGKPIDLHPFSNWSEVAGWQGLCGLSLARSAFGKYQTLAPSAAIKIEQRTRPGGTAPEFWVHLREELYWQPLSPEMFDGNVVLAPHFLEKHKVTASDFKLYLDAVMNPFIQNPGAIAARNALEDIESFEVVDDYTFVVRWKVREIKNEDGESTPKIKFIALLRTGGLTALPCFVYQYFPDGSKIIPEDSDPDTYRKNSVWAQNFSEHWAKNVIVSCGPWIFEKMNDEEIRFRRNPDHFEPLDPLIDGYVVSFKNTPDNMWREFQIDHFDLLTLGPDQQLEYQNFLKSPLYEQQKEEHNSIREAEYNARAYVYVGWNELRPFFKKAKERQAMTMAIDRERIIRQYLGGKGTQLSGPFSPFSSAYDASITPVPFDPEGAKKLLEAEGWKDSEGDGILHKEVDGVKVSFSFSLTYYVKNLTTKNICEYISTALKEIGVRCELKGVDLTDLSAVFDDKNFDALCMGWVLASPPEDVRQLWHSEGAKEPGSSNAIGFANADADKIIERLEYEDNPEKRKELYHRFHKIIYDEQPYTFLYVPRQTLLYRERVQNVFIPAARQDLVPGADMESPDTSVFWLKR